MRRRSFLKNAALMGMLHGFPGLVLARAETDARFLLVILRGGLDGLAAVPALGDPDYRKQRGKLALPTSGAGSILTLDGIFGLHPKLANLHRWYAANELVVLHAVATPYRKRSHFDGQDLLENGAARSGHLDDGWLNRAMGALPGSSNSSKADAIALAFNAPLVLQGDHPVRTWTPSRLPDPDEDTLERIARMYAPFPEIEKRFAEGRAMQQLAGDTLDGNEGTQRKKEQRFAKLARAAGNFLAEEEGPRVAVLENGGWDTHAKQGSENGVLAARLLWFDDAMLALRDSLGEAWQNTAILVVTEFGRTVAVNGTGGTDHGTAGCAFLLGGAVNGGRVLADWPGLSPKALYEKRDLRPTMDLREVFKGVLVEHLGVPEPALSQAIFPESDAAKPMRDLISKIN